MKPDLFVPEVRHAHANQAAMHQEKLNATLSISLKVRRLTITDVK